MQFDGNRRVHSFPVSHHQVNLEDCQKGTGLLVAVRMLLTDAFQSVGGAEVA